MRFGRKHSLTAMSLFALGSLMVGTGLFVAPDIAGASTASTAVVDRATNAPYRSGVQERVGASAYDTMTLVGDGVATPTGTVTYSYFQNGLCTGPATGTDPVTIRPMVLYPTPTRPVFSMREPISSRPPIPET